MEKSLMVVGIDDSEHGFYALDWTLQHFSSPSPKNSPFKLFIVHVKPSATMAVEIVGSGSADVVPYVEADLKKIASKVLEKAKEICSIKLVEDVILVVMEGDPRNVLRETVEKYHTSMLIAGNHGYGAIKMTVLGSLLASQLVGNEDLH